MIQHSKINGGSEPEESAWRFFINILIVAFNIAAPNNRTHFVI